MENLYRRIRQSKIFGKLPKKEELEVVVNSFSKREWAVFVGLVIVLTFSTLAILQNINKSFLVSVPQKGGEIKEGIKEVMIAGNIFELLKNVEAGKKVEYGSQGNYLPHVLFPKVNVVGK